MIYEYHCSNCSFTFDRRLSIADRNLPIEESCPSCHKLGNIQKFDGNVNGHIYGLGAEAKNNYGGFGSVLDKIQEKTKHMGGDLNKTRTI